MTNWALPTLSAKLYVEEACNAGFLTDVWRALAATGRRASQKALAVGDGGLVAVGVDHTRARLCL
ncbi:hypothetical protein ACWEJ6_52855, partial [Nonomuraea sp. NPDC004702]